MAIECISATFATSKNGDYSDPHIQGLISPEAMEVIMSLGDKSGRLVLSHYHVMALEASGCPCIVEVDLVQGHTLYKVRLDVWWGRIMFAMVLDTVVLPGNQSGKPPAKHSSPSGAP